MDIITFTELIQQDLDGFPGHHLRNVYEVLPGQVYKADIAVRRGVDYDFQLWNYDGTFESAWHLNSPVAYAGIEEYFGTIDNHPYHNHASVRSALNAFYGILPCSFYRS